MTDIVSPQRPLLLLLPGLLCDAAAWADQSTSLADLARCEIPSYGALNSIDAMARHVLATAPDKRFSLAGHSMGGRIALEVLRQAPERVERLALLDTGFQPLPAGAPGAAERASRMALLALSREAGMRAMGRQWVNGMVHPRRLGTPLMDAILDMIERSVPAIFEAQIQALLDRPDAAALLPQITCPTVLICGRDDAWSPLERHQQMQALIPGARLSVIEDSGHMAPMEQPSSVNRAMRLWLGAAA